MPVTNAGWYEKQLEERSRQLEEARRLLMQWQAYSRTLTEADITATPQQLDNKTTGFLDSTAS